MISKSALRTAGQFLAVFLFLALMVPPLSAQDATPESTAVDVSAYCQQSGGTVLTRYPAYNTNDPGNLIRFANPKDFCEFTDAQDARINVPLDVLGADQPTLAVLAYENPPKFKSGGSPSANPSYLYCGQLGGAINFGPVNASGGGWVSQDDPTDVVTMCVFADGSMLDSFGLFYKSDGTARGADLTPLFRWQPDATIQSIETSGS